jgi:hypothetical protein
MATEYRTVYDLTPEELDELRATYWDQLEEVDDDVIEEATDYEDVTDEMLFNHYDGISFVRDDFFCNMIEETEA